MSGTATLIPGRSARPRQQPRCSPMRSSLSLKARWSPGSMASRRSYSSLASSYHPASKNSSPSALIACSQGRAASWAAMLRWQSRRSRFSFAAATTRLALMQSSSRRRVRHASNRRSSGFPTSSIRRTNGSASVSTRNPAAVAATLAFQAAFSITVPIAASQHGVRSIARLDARNTSRTKYARQPSRAHEGSDLRRLQLQPGPPQAPRRMRGRTLQFHDPSSVDMDSLTRRGGTTSAPSPS